MLASGTLSSHRPVLQEFFEFFHRPVEVFLNIAVHFLREVGIGADLLCERQNPICLTCPGSTRK